MKKKPEPKKTKAIPKQKPKPKDQRSQKKVKTSVENFTQAIIREIQEYVDMKPKLFVFWNDDNFVLLVKSENLSVNRSNNNSVFQPYETSETKKYCSMSIIKVSDSADCEVPRFIERLVEMDCPVYKVKHPQGVHPLMYDVETN